MNIIPIGKVFENYIQITEDGFTDVIYLEELIKLDSRFQCNNGCQWARKGSYLDKKYNLHRFNAKELNLTNQYRSNKVVAIQLQGFKTSKIENHSIPNFVREALRNKPCVISGVISSEMEIDHKDGKYSKDKYELKDFQPMTKANNDAKREHCKKCNSTNYRFDATILGYPKPYIKGEADSNYCEGCYWYDPIEFRSKIYK